MINREPLSMLLVSGGDFYANDALQIICSRIFDYDNDKFLSYQARCQTDKSLYDTEEYKVFSKKLWKYIDLFNTIVGLGKEPALRFIKNNYEQFVGYKWKEDASSL